MARELPDDVGAALDALTDGDLVMAAAELAADPALVDEARRLNAELLRDPERARPLVGFFRFDRPIEPDLVESLREAMSLGLEAAVVDSPWIERLENFSLAVPDPAAGQAAVQLALALLPVIGPASHPGLDRVRAHRSFGGIRDNAMFGDGLSAASSDDQLLRLTYALFLVIFWRSLVVTWSMSVSATSPVPTAAPAVAAEAAGPGDGRTAAPVGQPDRRGRPKSDNERLLEQVEVVLGGLDWAGGGHWRPAAPLGPVRVASVLAIAAMWLGVAVDVVVGWHRLLK